MASETVVTNENRHSFSITVNQTAHGLSAGDVIRHNGTNYVKAKADAVNTLGLFVVSEIVNADNFTLMQSGYLAGLSGLTAGEYHFLSDSTSGAVTTTEPSSYSNPVMFAVSAEEAFVLPYRPSGGSASSVTNPAFSAHRNGSNQTGTITNQFTKLRWTTESFDTTGDFVHDPDDSGGATESRYTPSVAGKYFLMAAAPLLDPVDRKLIHVNIYKNGGSIATKRLITNHISAQGEAVSCIAEANGTTDYFEAYIYHETGVNEDVYGSSTECYFQGYRI